MCVPAASQSSWPIASCTLSSTWLHPWCGAELELPYLSVLDELVPPNQPGCCPPDCFSPGGTSPKLVLVLWWCLRSSGRSQTRCRLRAISGTPAAGMCRRGEQGKSLGLQISDPKPDSLGFLPRKSVLPLAAELCQAPSAMLPTAAGWC